MTAARRGGRQRATVSHGRWDGNNRGNPFAKAENDAKTIPGYVLAVNYTILVGSVSKLADGKQPGLSSQSLLSGVTDNGLLRNLAERTRLGNGSAKSQTGMNDIWLSGRSGEDI